MTRNPKCVCQMLICRDSVLLSTCTLLCDKGLHSILLTQDVILCCSHVSREDCGCTVVCHLSVRAPVTESTEHEVNAGLGSYATTADRLPSWRDQWWRDQCSCEESSVTRALWGFTQTSFIPSNKYSKSDDASVEARQPASHHRGCSMLILGGGGGGVHRDSASDGGQQGPRCDWTPGCFCCGDTRWLCGAERSHCLQWDCSMAVMFAQSIALWDIIQVS